MPDGRRRFGIPLLAAAFAAVGCHGPFGPIPGGRLTGVRAEHPVADWSFANDYAHAQLELRPHDPYSVTVDFYVVDGKLYLAIGKQGDWSRWRRYIRDDPRVRVRFGERVYDLLAVPCPPREVEKILPAYYAKDRDRPPPGCAPSHAGPACPPPSEFVRLVWRPYDSAVLINW
jgi:hypothetical protein